MIVRAHGSLWTVLVLGMVLSLGTASPQQTGTIRGMVTVVDSGAPLHHATVQLASLGRKAETDDDGSYRFEQVPPGRYEVAAHMHPFSDERQTVEVASGTVVTLDFQLRLEVVREQITVTASGREESTLEAFQSVVSLDSLELTGKAASSLGEVLDHESGVAKRSFGPGTARPVVRGFDGDRVLIMQDGVSTGTLSSQSGDHGEPINPMNLERLEVVKGPATLLYGSSAIGGVVNAVTNHHQIHQHPHEGLRGYLSGVGGTANAQGGGSGGFEYGRRHWLVEADGGFQRTGDYRTPIGTVPNSLTRMENGSGNIARYGEKAFASGGYSYYESKYGVPFAATFEEDAEGNPPVDLFMRRHAASLHGGLRNLNSFVEQFQLTLNYSDYHHRELEENVIGTQFFNKQFIYRGVFDQKTRGPLSGSFGFQGMRRDYTSLGVEALSPPVIQNNIGLFAVQQMEFKAVRLQFGGRVESNAYNPAGLPSRSFTGFSGSVGLSVPLWRDGSLLGNYYHSYRAPALEELYNHGPHTGNLTFEIGNPDLTRERNDGVDLSLRHRIRSVHAEANFFYYRLRDFIYLAPTGDFEGALPVARYLQANSRYLGGEARVDTHINSNLLLNLAMDVVDAQLTPSRQSLPRIPPLRGRFGIDARYKDFSFKPELVVSRAQNHLYTYETRTAGYAALNLGASYMVTRQHAMHVFSVLVFNATDRLYRNHLSFIKDLAPEIGRGVRVTYTVRFF